LIVAKDLQHGASLGSRINDAGDLSFQMLASGKLLVNDFAERKREFIEVFREIALDN